VGTLGTVDQDSCLALEDDEEMAAAHSLPKDSLPLAENLLLQRVGDLLELRRAQVGEQAQLRERLDDGLGLGAHRSESLSRRA